MPRKKGNFTQVKAKDVELAQALKKAGLSLSKATRVLGRGYNTVKMMYQAKDFDDYKRITKEENLKYKRKIEKKVEPTAQPPMSIREAAEATQPNATQWQRVFMSQTNAIIALLKAIEFKLDIQR